MKYTVSSTDELKQIAETLLSKLSQGESAVVVALSGDLGAGKTTFTKELAKLLGVSDVVASPTFVIEKVYPIDIKGFTTLIHIDAYRMETAEEIVRLGWGEIIADPANIICIEWPEKVGDAIPKTAIKISFKHGERENERIIEIIE